MAGSSPLYDELRIRFEPDGDERYRTVSTAADGSTAVAAFQVPFTELELDNFVLRVGRQRLSARSYHSRQMDEARQFGERLFNAMMVEGARDIFRSARAAAEISGKGLRLTLCLSDAPALMDLPWEFLYERPRFLSQSIYSPVVRSLDLRDVPIPHPVGLPLNVLGLISSPDGFDSLDVEEEKRKLGEALEKLVREGMVNLEWLEGGSLKELDGFINRNQGIHVFHFIGHGGYDTGDQRGILVLEGDRGEPQEVSGEELGLLFQDERGLKLAVLNSCEGARNSHIDPFSGAAASLVNFGVPAVIGMQFEITDQAAIAFSASLYEALARNMPVDAALAQARRSIFAAGNDIEFGTPVLFLRGRDARLFDVIDAPVPSPPSEAAGDDYGDEPKTQSGAEAERAPTYQAWIPRPWQERWGSLKADGFRVLGRIPTRLLAIGSVLLIVGGTVVTTAFGHENADGGHESILGAILVWLGTLGLLAALVKIAYSSLRARIRRLRDWWTGNG